MPILHLGHLQLECRRRPFAGMMIPSVGEQDTADVQKQRRNLCQAFHRGSRGVVVVSNHEFFRFLLL